MPNLCFVSQVAGKKNKYPTVIYIDYDSHNLRSEKAECIKLKKVKSN